MFGRSDVDDYNPYLPLRDQSKLAINEYPKWLYQ